MPLEDMNDETDDQIFQGLVEAELELQRVRKEASKLLHAVPFVAPPTMTFQELAQRALPEVRWVVQDLMAVGHNVLLSAEFKTGKSTLILNLIRALADGRPFLDRFPTSLDGNVCYMNYELTEQDTQLWVRDTGVRRASRCLVMNLRGVGNPLGSREGQEWLAAYLREWEVEFLVVDTFRAAYQGLSHNDNAEVGLFTRMLDEVKQQAGVPGLLLSNHFGRKDHEMGREHGAGATELDNWADMRWLLTRKEDERFLKVEGRGVGLEESLLTWDRDSRRLMVMQSDVGVSRERAGLKTIEEQVLDFVRATPGANTNKIVEGVARRKSDVIRVLRELVDGGRLVRREKGAGGSLEYTVSDGDFLDFG